MDIECFRTLLLKIRDCAGIGFSGVGIIVSDTPNDLPIIPLRGNSQFVSDLTTSEALLEISNKSSVYHDGFHLLSSALQVQLVSQYFSPPISTSFVPPKDRVIGGRYAAALFGSNLEGVVATGIVSSTYGVAIFIAGNELSFSAQKTRPIK